MTPASIRNNNPGAIYPGRSARKFGGQGLETLVSQDGKHPIVKFPTPVHGAAALFHNLMHAGGARSYYYRGQPLSRAIATWCGEHRAAAYLALIKQHAGYEPNIILTEEFLQSHETAVPLAKAMARHEAGKEFPLDQLGWLEAHAMAFGGGHIAPAPSPNNDVPTLRPEARWAATVEKARNVSLTLGLAGGGGASLPYIPSVPSHISETVANFASWKSLAVQVGSLGSEAAISAGAGVTVATGAFLAARKWLVRS